MKPGIGRVGVFGAFFLFVALTAMILSQCLASDTDPVQGLDETDVGIPVDDRGFPIDWPVLAPPGTVADCPNGEVSQESLTFSVVICLPDDPDPLTVATRYIDDLQARGFTEREPGAFQADQLTFLDGNGIEILIQLIGDEATIVLIKPF